TFGGWYSDAECTDGNELGDANESYELSADTTFFAKWTANEYTITYNANTDDATVAGIPAAQTKTYAQNLTLASGTPTRDGYTFVRWTTQANGGGSAFDPGDPLTADLATGVEGDDEVILYAQWSANTYVIDYDKGAGTGGATGSQTIRFDLLNTFTLNDCGFTYPGYTFTKWQDADGVQYDAGAAVTSALLLKGAYNSTDGYYHLTLTAQWLRNQSTLRVDHGNGDAVIEVTQDSNTTYNVEGGFTRTGYTFNGWALTGQDGAAPNGSVNDLTAAAPVYTFGYAHFVTDTLTAQWTPNPYTIIYHYNLPGATDNTRSVNVAYDTEFNFADEYFFTATGYTIDGWARTADASAYEFDCGASNYNASTDTYTNLCTGEGTDTEIHLYAVWHAKHYNVTFNTNTGFHLVEGETNPKDIIYNGSVTFTVQLEEGYTQATGADIAAHITSGTGAVPDGVKDPATNRITFTVTNHGEADIVVDTNALNKNTYTVTLQHENGSFDAATNGYNRPAVQSTVTHGDDVSFSIALLDGFHVANGSDLIASVTVGGTSAAPTVTGSYTYTVANATGAVVITLKDALKNESTVVFRGNGGTIDGVALVTDTKAYGETYTVSTPLRTGYTFTGWTRVTEGENASTGNGSLSGNVYTFGSSLGTDTYEAQWSANGYTITFSQEAAAGDPDWAVITKGTLSKSVVYDGAMPSIDNLPSRVGYDFLGYTFTDGGTDYRYDATGAVVGENKYTTAGNTTLYAKWQKHAYSITLDGEPTGYTVVYPPNAYYNDTYTVTITPDTGYDVNALNVSVTGNGGYTTAISGNEMTVTVTGVNADNVISVSGALLQYTVTTNLVNAEAFAGQPAQITVNYNTSGVTVEVTMADGYQQAAPAVEVVTAQTGLTASVAKKDGTDATYVITLSDPVTANVTLNLTGSKNTYNVTLNGTEVGYALPDPHAGTIEYLGNQEYMITLAAGYTQTQPSDISVTEVNGHAVLTKEDDTHIKVSITSELPGDVTVTLGDARVNTYTLTFVNNGGDTLAINSPVPASTSTIGYFGTFTFSVTLAEGYTEATPTLTSSNSDVTVDVSKSGSVVTYTVNNYFTGDTTLTLSPAAANQSTLTVHLGGGTLTGVSDGAVYTGGYKDTKSFGKPEKTGYTFVKWVLGGDGNGTLTGESSASATYTFGPTAGADDTLTATYTANTYHVNYHKNDGSNESTTKNVTYDGAWPEAPAFSRTGYDFAGWFVGPADDADAFVFGETYTTVGDTDVYAHWTVHTSTLVVNPNGGKVTVDNTEYNNATATITKAYGQTSTVGTPVKTGYTFLGWTRTGDNNGTLEGGTYTFGAGNGKTDTFTAEWQAKTYIVTYVKNDGTPETQTRPVTYNAAWPEAPSVTRTGWTFAGWHSDPENDSPVSFEGNYTVDGDTTVYAHWTINRSTVTFDPAEGTIKIGDITYTHASPYSVTDAYGETVSAPTPVRTGYNFTGWTRTSGNNGSLEGGTYTFGAAANMTDVYTAGWEARTFTVRYEKNDGTGAYETETVAYDGAWPTAPTFTRTGYDPADGWYTAAENGTLVDMSGNYTTVGNTTVYKYWTVHTSTVTVNLAGGTGATSGNYTQAYNTTLTLEEPTREGYSFGGWELTSEGTVNGSLSGVTYTFGAAAGTTDIITAKWNANTYTVRYEKNDGSDAYETRDVTYNAAWPEAPTFSRVGYDPADGWYTAAEDGALVDMSGNYVTAGNTTVYKYWNIHSSTVTVNLAGGNGTTSGDYTQNYGTTLTLAQPTREGYHFTGWVLSDNANGSLSGSTYTFGAADGVTDTITATWEIDTFTVTVVTGEGYTVTAGPNSPVDWNTSSSVTIALNEAYSASAAPAATVNNGTVEVTDNGDGTFTYTVNNIKENKTITIGNATRNEYDVTAVVTTGAVGINAHTPTAAVSVLHGIGTTTITVTLEDGYSNSGAPAVTLKEGGAAELSGGVKSTVDGKTVYTYTVSNVTKNSEFEIGSATPNTYTVRYEKNDGTAAYETEAVTFDGAWPEAPTFTRTGYTPVDGWFTGAADTDPAYTFGATYTTVGDTTVYKHWTINKSKLTVDPAGGSVTVDGTAYTAAHTFEQDYNTTLTVEEPTREGYHFTGWTREIVNGTFLEGEYRFGPTAGVEDKLTATWEIDTFTVTLTKGVGYVVVEGPQSPVNWNTDSYVKIRLVTGYTNSGAPEATVNGAALPAVDNGDDTFTYTVTGIKEDKVIVIGDATKNTYDVTFSEADGNVGIESFTPSVNVEHETGTATVTVTLEAAYSDSDAPAVTLASGNAEISGGVKSIVDGKTVYTYTVSNVTEPSAFVIGPASPNKYIVSFDATRVGYTVTETPASFVYYQGTATAKITLLDGYSETDENTIPFTVTEGTYATKSVSRTGNVITYTVTGITANTAINIGSATINRYDIALVADGTGYTVTENPAGVEVVEHGGSATVKLTLAEGYSNTPIPTITVKNAANEDIGTAIGSKVDNVITYIVTGITDDVTIKIGPATINSYVISINTGVGTQIQRVGSDTPYNAGDTVTVTHGTVFEFRLTDPTLTTPVYINGVEAHPNADGIYSFTVTQNSIITTDNLMYIAIFQNEDGTVVEQHIIVRGNSAYCNTIPTKASTHHHDYVFSGWLCINPAGDWEIGENMTNMTEDRIYKAVYTTHHKNLLIADDETNHWWYCPECGYTEGTEAHIEGAIEIENYVQAMCTVQGSHDEVVYCAVCRRELSRTTVNDGYDYTNHTTTETYYEVLYDATCTTPGMKVFYCADCDHVVRYEEIPVNPANHCWGAWIDDGDGVHHHRGCAYCGEENMQTRVHSLRELHRSAPTCVNEGCIVSYCPDCGTVITEILAATGIHTPGDVIWENYVAPTCVDEGGYDAVTKCAVCRIELSNTHVTLEATGIHDYDVTYSVENPTCTQSEPIIATYTCRICGDTYTEEIPVPGVHTVTNWTTTKIPTESDPVGYRTGTCDLCGETVTEELYFKPAGQRFIQFIGQDGVTYTVVNYDTHEEERVSGTVTYYTNVTMKFYVTVNSSFPYSDYDVYVDGVKISQNADGSYSIPPADSGANIKVVGTIPAAINPGDSGTDQGSNVKLSFWQRIINFFKRLFSIFQR
ncbi:MAG: InlB B-repeat-containing protein, partial [Clostridia bacterium]|nr:InlB B-repeat-containing protein [Clostridia bacterium]